MAASLGGLACRVRPSWAAEAATGAGDDPAGFAELFVAPAPDGDTTATGTGTAGDPLLLSAGGEYRLNRAIRPFMDAERKLAVRFAPGVYHGVRLQILREGTDRDMIYLRERHGAAITYHDTTTCNAQGQNCRVQPPDYAIGPDRDAPLLLLGDPSGATVFDGQGLGGLPQIEDEALLIAGAAHSATPVACDRSESPHIRNVHVRGLHFRNYANGIHVTRGEDVVIGGCSLDQIGNRQKRDKAINAIGTFALRADGLSRRVLLHDNQISNVWNLATDSDPAGVDDPGLIHAVYQGYSADIVFRSNRFAGCSGPMVKFGFYPALRDAMLECQFPTAPRDRCMLFLDNEFVLQPMRTADGMVPVYAPQQGFVEENSVVEAAGSISAPAGGVIFVGNRFTNALDQPDVPVIFLRQELPSGMDAPVLPGWAFAGNRIAGVPDGDLIGMRTRGTALSVESIRRVSEPAPLYAALVAQATPGATVPDERDQRQAVEDALQAISEPADAQRNAALLSLAFDQARAG